MKAGGLSVVEKVKPDPLNLMVNTNVGKPGYDIFMVLFFLEGTFFVLIY